MVARGLGRELLEAKICWANLTGNALNGIGGSCGLAIIWKRAISLRDRALGYRLSLPK
jgi:hypothetical protein